MQIKMNGQPVNVKEGATIMEAASGDKYARTQFDLEVLSLQYLKGVQETDNSGLCIAEIAGQGIARSLHSAWAAGKTAHSHRYHITLFYIFLCCLARACRRKNCPEERIKHQSGTDLGLHRSGVKRKEEYG